MTEDTKESEEVDITGFTPTPKQIAAYNRIHRNILIRRILWSTSYGVVLANLIFPMVADYDSRLGSPFAVLDRIDSQPPAKIYPIWDILLWVVRFWGDPHFAWSYRYVWMILIYGTLVNCWHFYRYKKVEFPKALANKLLTAQGETHELK